MPHVVPARVGLGSGLDRLHQLHSRRPATAA